MTNETAFRILFWVLFGAVLLMRFYFIFRLRRVGQRVLPDQQAIALEGKGLFAFRLVSWFLMMGILLSYALNLACLRRFVSPFLIGCAGWDSCSASSASCSGHGHR